MNTIKLALLFTCLASAAGAAFAQGRSDVAAQPGLSAEMNRPQDIGYRQGKASPQPTARVSEADAKAEAFGVSAQMMRPENLRWRASGDVRHGATRSSDADRAMAETLNAIHMMKPN